MSNILTIDELEMLNPFELGELLHIEVKKSSPDFQYIQDLLDVGCPIDARSDEDDLNRTPLHLAAQNGKLEVVEFLLSNGAELDARDIHGQTALQWGAYWGWLEVVKFLISKGADIHARNRYGNSAFDVAAQKIKDKYPELEPK